MDSDSMLMTPHTQIRYRT